MQKMLRLSALLAILCLSACTNQSGSFPKDPITGLPAVVREGDAPQTSDAPLNTNIAHQQETQQSPPELQEELWDRMSSLSNITTGASRVSVAGARALYSPNTTGPTIVVDERIHLHPSYDGSLHAAMPRERIQFLEKNGRGESHPRNPTTIMLYGPRNESELLIIQEIIQQLYLLHTND